MFEEMTVAKMYNLNETIAKDIFEGVTYPWEVLPKISDFIVKLGETLPADEYDKVRNLQHSCNVEPVLY